MVMSRPYGITRIIRILPTKVNYFRKNSTKLPFFFWPDSGFENLIKGVGIYVTFAK